MLANRRTPVLVIVLASYLMIVLAHRIATSLTAGTAMLALALALVAALIVRPRAAAEVAENRAVSA